MSILLNSGSPGVSLQYKLEQSYHRILNSKWTHMNIKPVIYASNSAGTRTLKMLQV